MSSKVSKRDRSAAKKAERKSELAERNEELKRQLETAPRTTRSVLEGFTKWRIATYAWAILLPPYGLYRIWSKESTFVRSERIVWTFMLLIYMLRFLWLILFS